MRLPGGRVSVPADVLATAVLGRGEKVLAGAPAADGSWLLGTRRRLVLVGSHADPGRAVVQLPWEQVEDASWDKDSERLTVTGTATYGERRPTYSFDMDDPALLLQLLRERVTASIVLQRWVPVRGRQGLTVIGRRNPAGGEVAWMHAYDRGLDPQDPAVSEIAASALAQARSEVGEEPTAPI